MEHAELLVRLPAVGAGPQIDAPRAAADLPAMLQRHQPSALARRKARAAPRTSTCLTCNLEGSISDALDTLSKLAKRSHCPFIDPAELEWLQPLNFSDSAVVWYAFWSRQRQLVAVKALLAWKELDTSTVSKRLARMFSLHSPRLVPLLGVTRADVTHGLDAAALCVVMEYQGSDLHSVLSYELMPLSLSERLHCAIHCVQAVLFMHSVPAPQGPLAHGSLHASHFLLDPHTKEAARLRLNSSLCQPWQNAKENSQDGLDFQARLQQDRQALAGILKQLFTESDSNTLLVSQELLDSITSCSTAEPSSPSALPELLDLLVWNMPESRHLESTTELAMHRLCAKDPRPRPAYRNSIQAAALMAPAPVPVASIATPGHDRRS